MKSTLKALTLVSTSFIVLTLALAEANPPLPAGVASLSAVPTPADNAPSDAKVLLGKTLYFDKRLSADDSVSCNTCHNVMTSGTDGLKTSKGIKGQFGGRNSPTVWNSAYSTVQFWDGRAASLEDQAKGPITNPIEMGMKDHDAVMAKVKGIPTYKPLFEKAFGPNSETIDNLARAIAAYERTLVTPDSDFDRYARGDSKALSPAALRGLKTVQDVGCLSFHSGPMFNGQPQAMGQGTYQKFPVLPDAKLEKIHSFSKDLGRYEVTKNDADKNMWRVPTWRNVDITGPYFHTGTVNSLFDAVKIMAKTQLNRELTEGETKDIVAFLKSLTGKRPKQTAPKNAKI